LGGRHQTRGVRRDYFAEEETYGEYAAQATSSDY
jgi:hypothetical protein